MGEKTGILWTDHTFNPWIGCTKVSPGCANCYAERENNVFKWNPNGWGENADRIRTSENNWKEPIKWAKQAVKAGVIHRVFCASLADVFDDRVPFQWLSDLWKLIADTQAIGGLEWLILTKRPENISTRIPTAFNDPGSCVRMGVTAENQEMADKRIPILLRSWSGKNFLSVEPMLGAMNLPYFQSFIDPEGFENNGPMETTIGLSDEPDNPINWVICGGESGPGARPMHPDWARSLRDQCVAANTHFFFKQWGEWARDPNAPIVGSYTGGGIFLKPNGSFGNQGDYWDGNAAAMNKVGKKNAGSLLDGKEWKQFPEMRNI